MPRLDGHGDVKNDGCVVLANGPDVAALVAAVIVRVRIPADFEQFNQCRDLTRRAIAGMHVALPEAGCLGEERPLRCGRLRKVPEEYAP